jgi:preprotein translocase subunit SecG
MTVILVTLFFLIMILVDLARKRTKSPLAGDQMPKGAPQKR